MKIGHSNETTNNYPEFSETLEFSNLIENLLNVTEITEEALYPIHEIQYLSRLKLDTKNKFRYYCCVIENYSHLVRMEIKKRKRETETILAQKVVNL